MDLENLLAMFLASPEVAEDMIKEQINKYKPLVYAVLYEGFEVFKDLVSNNEYFEQRAQFKRKMYEAYINTGFTPEEAMMFLVKNDFNKADALKQLISNVNIKSKQD